MLRVILLLTLMLSLKTFAAESPAIVMVSDYGLLDESVAVCKGVIFSQDPKVKVIDLTHQVPAFSVKEAARFLTATTPYYPAGTIFMGLVEKHGGKKTKKLVALTKKEQFILAPDNGMLTPIAERDGLIEVREIAESAWVTKSDLESIFPGRDVYAKIAAHLSQKEDWKTVGPPLSNWFRLENKKSETGTKGILGEVVALDGTFGNLITNLSVTSLLNAGYTLTDMVSLQIGDKPFSMKFAKTFEDVPLGTMLIYIDTTDHASIAINQGNFATKHKVKIGTKVLLQNKASKK